MLKAKLTRFNEINKKGGSTKGKSQQVTNSLEKQARTIEQLTKAKRAEIAQLVYSDRAAVITELQEESKMLHCEILRLRKTKQETDDELKRVSNELEDTCAKYSPEVLNRQQKTIRTLQKGIAAQQQRNDKLRQKIEQMKKEQENEEEDEENAEMQKQINDLKKKIRQERQNIQKLDEEIARINEEHDNEMQELQNQM